MGQWLKSLSAEFLFGVVVGVLPVVIDPAWDVRLLLVVLCIGIIWHLLWRTS